MIQGGEFLEKRIGVLFDVGTGSLLDSSELIEGNINRISVKSDNNGVIGRFQTNHLVNARHFENFITVNFFGNSFYHPYEASVEMKVHTLKLKDHEFDKYSGLYIKSALDKSLSGKFGYGNQLSSSLLRTGNFFIELPYKNEDICFDYMRAYTKRLIDGNLDNFKKYLQDNNLLNYDLSDAERLSLVRFNKAEQLSDIKWVNYNLKDLFGSATRGQRLKKSDRIEGHLPFVTAGEADTGVSGFVGNKVHKFKANTITIDMFGSAKYRNYDYGGDDHVAVVHTERLPKFASIFVTSAIHKASYNGQFDYGRNFYAKDADALTISLPSKDDGTPDYEYMNTLISAIHKTVIKGVVEYVEKSLEVDSL